MSLPKRIRANRESMRAPVVPTKIQGVLTRPKSGDQCPFLIWDVSKEGLGLWCSDELGKDEEITLTVGQPYPLMLECSVVWIERSPDGEGYRCGLRANIESSQLKALYRIFSDLMEKNASSD